MTIMWHISYHYLIKSEGIENHLGEFKILQIKLSYLTNKVQYWPSEEEK